MKDTIRGMVTSVIDGDTFDMSVTHTGKNNSITYNNAERIRIAGIDKPEINTDAGKKAKTALENKLNGKEVRITIDARDDYRRIVGTVEILN